MLGLEAVNMVCAGGKVHPRQAKRGDGAALVLSIGDVMESVLLYTGGS